MEKSQDTLIYNIELSKSEIGTIIMALSTQVSFYGMLSATFGGEMINNAEEVGKTIQSIQLKLIETVGK